jgi:magnesium transporter
MKVLTIITTFFMPLTFITGFYGMNFKHIPGLDWRWGVMFITLGMILLVTVMFLVMRKRKWI